MARIAEGVEVLGRGRGDADADATDLGDEVPLHAGGGRRFLSHVGGKEGRSADLSGPAQELGPPLKLLIAHGVGCVPHVGAGRQMDLGPLSVDDGPLRVLVVGGSAELASRVQHEGGSEPVAPHPVQRMRAAGDASVLAHHTLARRDQGVRLARVHDGDVLDLSSGAH